MQEFIGRIVAVLVIILIMLALANEMTKKGK